MTGERRRLFFAVWPDAGMASAMADEARQLVPRLDCRPMRAETLHLTLAFLGDRSGMQRERLCACVDAADRADWPGEFMFRLDRVRQWRHNGIVIAAASERCDSLYRLAELVGELSRRCGIDLPLRPFVPHLTLLRRCRAVLPSDGGAVGPWPVVVRAFRLVESFLSPAGASYRVVGEWALPQSPPAATGR